MDWRQLWEIMSAPDNVPIIALIPLLAFFIFLAWRQGHANDLLIEQLEGDAALAKTHHRKAWPFKPGGQKEIHVWPFLLRVEFLAAIIVTIILMVWSITLNAPLEEPSNPNVTIGGDSETWANKFDVDVPLGKQLFGHELRTGGYLSRTQLFGDIKGGLNTEHLNEVHTRLVLDFLNQLWKAQWIGIGASYYWGSNFNGWSVGADVAFRF